MIRIVVRTDPVGQMRARHGTRRLKSGNILSKTYKDGKQIQREETLSALLAPMVPDEMFTGQIVFGLKAFIEVPQSKSKKWKAQAISGAIRPTSKPDLDNILKHVKDVMTRLKFWKDDALIVEYEPGTGKYYDTEPRLEITIRRAGGGVF